ncbi:MAG: hypothetical protein HKO59_11535 [Phycisphaerales bacterium]|nr:hypothetical protein [Phycisphaerae bacterium]NNF43437.1 hypothetical protein [Phycisphaerales bacterium]NNM26594.1 hypothetical protein [Phycisphaerales bacterium]
MIAPDAELITRVRRLERANRRLTIAALVVGIAGVAAWAGPGAPPADVLTARTIRMVDQENRVRAEIGTDEDGSAGFFLRDAEGRVRSAYVHDDSQTAMLLLDDAGVIRVGTALFAHGGGGIALHGDASKGAAVLYLKDRRGTLTFFDEHGTVIERTPPASQKGEQP